MFTVVDYFHCAEERTAAACRLKSAAVPTQRQTVGAPATSRTPLSVGCVRRASSHRTAEPAGLHSLSSACETETGSKQTNKHQNKSRQRREKSP